MKYLILLSIISIILISCTNNKVHKNSNIKTTQISNIDSSITKCKNDQLSSNVVDSAFMYKVNYIKDSIYSNKKNYKLIILHELDGDCYSLDSLYFNNLNTFTMYISSSGCSGDEASSFAIYNSTGLVYYHMVAGGEGVIKTTSEIYYKNNSPAFGIQKLYEWNWETKKLQDSSSVMLSKKELKDITKLKNSVDKNYENAVTRIQQLPPEIMPDNKYKFVDTIQKFVENRYYIVDSAVYFNKNW